MNPFLNYFLMNRVSKIAFLAFVFVMVGLRPISFAFTLMAELSYGREDKKGMDLGTN